MTTGATTRSNINNQRDMLPSRASVRAPAGRVRNVELSPDGAHVAVLADDGQVNLWWVPKFTADWRMNQQLGGFGVWGVGRAGFVVTDDVANGSIRIVPVIRGLSVLNNYSTSGMADYLAGSFDRSGLTFLSLDANYEVARHDLQTGGQTASVPLQQNKMAVAHVAFSGDGSSVALADHQGIVTVHDTKDGSVLGELHPDDARGYNAIALSPDGSQVTTLGSNRRIRLWDVGSETTTVEVFDESSGNLLGVEYSPDGMLLAVFGQDGTIRLLQPDGDRVGDPIRAHTGMEGVTALSFDATGQVLVSGGDDGVVRFWLAATGEPIGDPLTFHTSPIAFVSFVEGTGEVVSIGRAGELIVWPGSLLDPVLACREFGDLVDTGTLRSYLPSDMEPAAC